MFNNDTTKLKKQIVAAAKALMGAAVGFLTGGNETGMDLFKRYDIDEQYVRFFGFGKFVLLFLIRQLRS